MDLFKVLAKSPSSSSELYDKSKSRCPSCRTLLLLVMSIIGAITRRNTYMTRLIRQTRANTRQTRLMTFMLKIVCSMRVSVFSLKDVLRSITSSSIPTNVERLVWMVF